MCGHYTNAGTSDQDEGQPLYDGVQSDWVFEEVDLSDYLGESDVRFKFRLISDIWTTGDGYYFDDFMIYADDGSATTDDIEELSLADISVYPNPAGNYVNIRLKYPASIQTIEVLNEIGQHVADFNPEQQITQIATSDWAEGIYFVKIIDQNRAIFTKKLTIIR